MAYAARILADSVSETGDRLTTMEVTFPRLVLAEFNTHRVFSRNSASSRAIPVAKQLERIENDPFIPIYWGKNQSGMQAEQELDTEDQKLALRDWLRARDYAAEQVQHLLSIGVHKQIANRLLEPFMWQTVLVTSTEWSNFFALRAHRDAQPEIRVIAEMMQRQYNSSTPTVLKLGQWHLPLIQPEEFRRRKWANDLGVVRKVSAARCARVSYLTHNGRRNFRDDLKLYERLVSGGHMSPLEHVATPEYSFRHQVSYRLADTPTGLSVPTEEATATYSSEFIGNFRGWKQFRKFIPGESDYSQAE